MAKPPKTPAKPTSKPVVKRVVVSLQRQVITAYEGETSVYSADCVTGREGHLTPPGTYKVLEKDAKHYSRTYDAPMPWSVKFDIDWKALHGSPGVWLRSNLHALMGTSLIPALGSHGCVGMAESDAKWFFEWTRIGTPIIVEP